MIVKQSVLDAESTGTGDVPQVLRESEVGVELAQASVADYVRYLMAADRKLGPMKALQVRCFAVMALLLGGGGRGEGCVICFF